MKYTKIVINVICYLKYFSLSVQIVFKYDYLSRKVWLTWLFYIISHFLCVFLYLVWKHNYMDSQDIRGLLKEVFQHIEQRIDSGGDYSVLETAIKGNEEMMRSSVIASLLDTRGAHGQKCRFLELFLGYGLWAVRRMEISEVREKEPSVSRWRHLGTCMQ